MALSGKVLESFRRQSAGSRMLGSAFTATLCDLLAEHLDARTRFGSRIIEWPGDPGNDALPLRATGGLHALARSGRAAGLITYPPTDIEPARLWSRLAPAIAEHDGFLHDYLDSPPQTNEVARSGAILGGCLQIAEATGLPLAIYEIGASAGLNLGFDRYRYDLGVGGWGVGDSTVLVKCRWEGEPPRIDAPLSVVERAGCDRSPLDPVSAADRERLLSYIWADQHERLARTAAALDFTSHAPWRVERHDAADWVEKHFAGSPMPGRVRILVHTIVWQYLPSATRDRIEMTLRQAGERASRDAPVAWLRMEYDGDPNAAGLHLTLWPGGEDVSLGRADYHGRWVHWEKAPSRWRWRTAG